jgi:Epoxide hydrolase N terminus
MDGTVEKSADGTAIRPFTFEIPQADLDDLRSRVAATRWPDKEQVPDHSQGVQLETIQTLASYWGGSGRTFGRQPQSSLLERRCS